jgi:NAD-dependent dihydropyrimidine dehydrogenase PreA subunit
MTHVICEPCINVKDKSCVEVCPVDCIKELPDGSSEQLYIDPATCIDCGACVSACPVEAIYAEADVPEKWQHFIEKNRKFFEDHPELRP